MCKPIFILSLYFISFQAAFSQFNIQVKIDNVTSKNGTLMIALWNSEENFGHPNTEYKGLKLNAGESVKTVKFDDIPSGTYAVGVFHDLNNNGKLDKNLIGIPKEPFGFSYKEEQKKGPPKWEQVSFKLNSNSSLIIKLVQW